MLTDYHTHLRPDDLEATAKDYFTEENLLKYLETASAAGIEELGFSEHIHRFTDALLIWDHSFWQEQAVDDLEGYFGFLEAMKQKGYAIKAGLELDWVPGKEEQLARVVEMCEWDYVLGSVHFLGDLAVDHPAFDIWQHHSADEIWSQYFTELGRAAASGLFDILAHPDLVKIWGKAPEGDLGRFYRLAFDGIGDSDIAVEVSTAGLRKPVGEIYPAAEFLKLSIGLGWPVALSSDAHVPEEIGFGYGDAVSFIESLGVSQLAVFERGSYRLEPLGSPS